jgi:hypothetical protein
MKKRHFISGAALLIMSSLAFAQLGGLGNVLGGKKNDSNISPEQIVKDYVGGAKNVMIADSHMLTALGLKDQADAAAVQAKNLTEGASKDVLESANKLQTENSKLLEEKLSGKKVVMDEKSKKEFSQGLIELSKGVIQYVSMSKSVSGFKPSPTSIGASTNSAIFIAKTLPTSLTGLGKTLKMAIDFSKENNIPVPKEANDATAML